MASRLVRFSAGALLLLAPAVAGADALRNGPLPAPLVADESWWRTDVSAAPVDPSSAAYIAFIGTNRGLHPDFGGYVTPCEIYGFAYVTVDATQPRLVLPNHFDDMFRPLDRPPRTSLTPSPGISLPLTGQQTSVPPPHGASVPRLQEQPIHGRAGSEQ